MGTAYIIKMMWFPVFLGGMVILATIMEYREDRKRDRRRYKILTDPKVRKRELWLSTVESFERDRWL